MEQQHLVQKFTFDVGFDSEEQAFEFQNKFASFAKEHLLAIADEIFSELSSSKIIRINKLELDLGDIPLDGFEEETYYRFREKLKDKLRLLIQGYSTSDVEEKVEFISSQQSDLELLEHFLNYGFLPWSARKNNPEFSINKLLIKLIESSPVIIKKYLVENLVKSDFRKRIIRQIEDEVLWQIILLFHKTEEKVLKQFYKEVTTAYRKRSFVSNTFSEFREIVWTFIINNGIIKKKNLQDFPVIVKTFVEYIPSQTAISKEEAVKAIFVSLSDNPSFASAFEKKAEVTNVPQTLEETFAQFIKSDPELNKVILEFRKEDGRRKTEELNRDIIEKSLIKDDKDDKDSGLNNFIHESEEGPISFSDQLRKKREEQQKQREQHVYNVLIRFFELPEFNRIKAYSKEALEEIEFLLKEYAIANPILLRRVIADAKFDIKQLVAQRFIIQLKEETLNVILPEVFGISIEELNELMIRTERQAIIQFIETGYFPFSIFVESLPKKELQKIFSRVFKSEEEIKNLKEVIAESFKDKQRQAFKIAQLRQYLPEVVIKKYFSEYIQFSEEVIEKSDIKNVSSNVKKVTLEEVSSVDVIIYFIQHFIKERALSENVSFTIDELIQKFIQSEQIKAGVYFTTLKDKEIKFILKNITLSVAAQMEKAIKELKDRIVIEEEKATKGSQQEEEVIESAKKDKKLSDERAAENEPELKKVQLGDPIYINNAGLVIFNPYLTRFFNMLGLTEKREFKDEYSAHKAAHILQYLVDKSENKEEHEMALNKLLCGIDLHVPLIRDIEITEEDKKTCDSLIEGVIQNWTILKSTSIDNFRISFLMREGRLVLEPQGWKLKVEERGYDILVEKIPWAISMIKLPWMKKMIYVEWK